MAKKQWIAVVGRNGSGKSAVCSYLQQKGFVCVSLSQILRQLAKEAQQNISRETLIGFGTKLKEQFGKDILAKKALETVEKQNTHVVFDSIRLPEELLFLKKHHVFLLGVASRLDARFKRIKARFFKNWFFKLYKIYKILIKKFTKFSLQSISIIYGGE